MPDLELELMYEIANAAEEEGTAKEKIELYRRKFETAALKREKLQNQLKELRTKMGSSKPTFIGPLTVEQCAHLKF